MDRRWPLMYKWGQIKGEILDKEYETLHRVFGDLVRYFTEMELVMDVKNSYLSIYDWAEVNFWPLVKLQADGSVKCPDVESLKPLLCDAIRKSYNLWRYEMKEVPVEEKDWEDFVSRQKMKKNLNVMSYDFLLAE